MMMTSGRGFDKSQITNELSADWLAGLGTTGEVQHYPAGRVFVREGEPEHAIYILLSGRVRVFSRDETGREVVFNVLERGDYFGEMCLDGESRSASVAALEPTTCVVIDETRIRRFLSDNPEFAFNLILKLIQRVRHATAQVKSLALTDVYSRVVTLLQQRAEWLDGRHVISEQMTQREIAARVGATREMVNRILVQLRKGGYIAKDGGRRIVILKPLPKSW
ncbi:Crp/Fnr family transcriptional regulator [Pseudomarimonas arenosa]|uniref:CRP-like protein Clp n=1 Tax=Pseudomarimonas arenosa TaxID=2774145 RepID=A0AAW3ZVS6_9GAMM|nr:Crp/Fnr family transcriptional regulator [Pseudomarimonas arenosa]MBD8528156.1 Crp/Fnr family transcriptional regulator [Pseudomarimonas arenosa]